MSVASVTFAEDRPTLEEVVLSFIPPRRRTVRLHRLYRQLPILLTLVGQAVLSWRLENIVANDEGLYIDAGHDLINQVFHHGPGSYYGTFFSGSPALYPVLAAGLDTIGGLRLVRLFSLLCMLATTLLVHRTGAALFGRRAAVFAAVTCASSGAVLYVGKYATYDAVTVLLVASALYLAVARPSVRTGIVIGILLAVAAATKYGAVAFIPFVVVVSALTGNAHPVRRISRAAVAGLTAAALLLGGYHEWGSHIAQGVSFTTTSRSVESYQSHRFLAFSFLKDVGATLAVALVGIVVLLCQRSWRQTLIAATCAGAALVLPAGQFRVHEAVSFDKHTDFAAVFLALPAGFALDWVFTHVRDLTLTGRITVRVLACCAVWLALISGLAESRLNYSWPSTIARPLSAISANPIPGQYLDFDQGSVGYYTRHLHQVRWTAGFALFDGGDAAIVRAVQARTFVGFLYRRGENGPKNDAQLGVLQAALSRNPAYRLVGTYRVDPYHTQRWYLWQRITSAPSPQFPMPAAVATKRGARAQKPAAQPTEASAPTAQPTTADRPSASPSATPLLTVETPTVVTHVARH